VRFERVLVTGGSGRLGRFVVDELAAHWEVSVLDIEPPAQAVAFAQADVLDLDAVIASVAGHEAVVHLAGIDADVDSHEKDYFETNVQGTWNVLHAAERAGVRKVVVASSVAALGIDRARMPDYLPVDEAHALRPVDAYGLSKKVTEVVGRSFARRGALDVVCLRPTLIVRPEREAAILAQLALDDPESDPPASTQGDTTAPYGALSVVRGYVRSRDVARCFRLALEHDTGAFDVFNVAADDNIGRVKTLEHLQRAFGRLPEVRDEARYARDPCAGVLANARAREILGWRPEGDWNDIAGAALSSRGTGAQ